MTATPASAILAVGDAAPLFSIPAPGGARVDLAQLRGKIVALYFYPKDDTTGCTREGLDFTALGADFAQLGAVVVGVSRDSVESHAKFAAKHGLSVLLASDEDGAVCAAYGVWVEKSMYGKKYMGIDRATFLIDGDGMVRAIWRKVKVPGHAAAVLEAARKLASGA